MVIFGPDISSYQHGVNVRALTDPFVMMKCTEDVGYVDADYPGWLAQAKASGKLVVAYHFIGRSDPAAQAAHLAAHIIDRSVPVMVDFEDEGAFHPTLAQLLAVNDAISAAGLRVRLNYLPRWKWSEMGSPSLSSLSSRGIALISSAYPGGTGYPGDDAAGWQPYGGMTPLLYQFTDSAVEGGQSIGDRNAFKGTRDQFAAFLGVPAPIPTTPGVSDMPLSQQDVDAVVAAVLNHQVPRAGSMGGTTSLGAVLSWSDQHIIDITAAVAKPPAVDVGALSAALAPLLQAAVAPTPDDVANAVVAHLAAQMAKG